jgi:hypothetical protein
VAAIAFTMHFVQPRKQVFLMQFVAG